MFKTIFYKILKVIIFFVIIGVLFYGYLLFQNNKKVKPPNNVQYREALFQGITWLENNKSEVIKIDNAILWWFLSESVKLTDNNRLRTLVDEYLNSTLDPHSIWNYYFKPNLIMHFDSENLFHFPAYNLFFIYSLTCNDELGQLDVIKNQLEPNFCQWSPIVSPCTTHQLMGLNFMRLRHCGDQNAIDNITLDLQKQIERQLTIDPRVGDVYIQRVLMMVATGAMQHIKPVWLKRILEAQGADGSWQSFHPLFPVGNSSFFGFSYFSLGIKEYQPNFHATAQAIYLLSLMSKEIETGQGQ